MARQACKRIPYLHRRGDTSGWFFMRRVPMDLRDQVGKQSWRWLLAHDLPTARLRLPGALAETDRLIATLRGEEAPSTASGGPLEDSPRALTREQDRLMLQGRPALIRELVEVGAPLPDPNELAELAALPPATCGLTPTSSADLLELGCRLKRPAEQTVLAWKRALKEFSGWLSHDHLQLTTRQNAADFRDHLLGRGLKVSTVKLRLNYLAGLFGLAMEEELFSSNPFQGVGKRLKTETKSQQQEEEIDVESLPIHKLKPDQLQLFYVLRYTGCRLAEVAGLELQDIDLEQGIITIEPKPDRPLKTRESHRQIPIHSKLRPTLEELLKGDPRPWRHLYNPNTKRWGGGLVWGRLIGCSPHDFRHLAITCMRSASCAETVIGRVVGHKVPGTTASYGTVSMELMRAAVETIK